MGGASGWGKWVEQVGGASGWGGGLLNAHHITDACEGMVP